MMNEITELKTKRSEDSKGEIISRRIKASLLFVVLKKLNRLEKFRTKTSRDTMNRVKQQVDSYHLQLQNLLYEIEHLKKEVTKCLQFKSIDEEIELVTVEEFYKEAPATLSRPEVTQTNPHQLKLARLEWELEQRKQLSALCSKLQTAKEMVGKEIQTKKERLDNLTPRLKSILEVHPKGTFMSGIYANRHTDISHYLCVTKPLQEYLGLPLDKIRKQHQVAYLLPKPLYVLYVQADAYREACDTLMLVSVSGDEEEARLLKNTKNEEKVVEESDSDQEDNSERDKRHHRKLSRSDRLEERKKRLLLRHPLTVHITIKLKGQYFNFLVGYKSGPLDHAATEVDGNSVQLSFHYLMNLHVVTVKTRLNLENTVHGSSALDLIAPSKLLSGLFAHDLGLDSPNVANNYQLQHLGLNCFSSYISELGVPYIWVQRVAGLDFMGARTAEIMDGKSDSVEPKTSVSQASVESVMRAVRQRLKARIALCKQVQALENGSVVLPHNQRSLFPCKSSSSLSGWQRLTWEEYQAYPHTQPFVREEVVGRGDIFYSMVVSRGTAKLLVLLAVKCDYPCTPSVYCLHLNWNGEHHAGNNDAVRDMEREMNVYWMELVKDLGHGWGSSLLVAQMNKLMSCLDLYLEAAGTTGIAPAEFSRERIFFKPVSKNIDKKSAECRTCRKNFKTPSGTIKTLLNHLQKHPGKYKEFLDENNKKDLPAPAPRKDRTVQQNIQTMLSREKMVSSHPYAQTTTNKITNMLVKGLLPYSFVEEEGFVELVKHFAPNYKIPARTTFSRNYLAVDDSKSECPGVKKLLQKAKNIVGHYRRSSQARERLHSLQERMQVPQLELIQYVETRWSSEYCMLQRLVEMKGPIAAELAQSEHNIEPLTNADWAQAKGVLEVLEPLAQATKEISGDSYPTSSMVIPILHCLSSHLNSRIQRQEEANLSTALRNELYRDFEEMDSTADEPEPSTSNSGLWSFFDSLPNERKEMNISEEVEKYLSEPRGQEPMPSLQVLARTTWTQELLWLLNNDFDYDTARRVNLVERFPFLEFSTLLDKEVKGEVIAKNPDNPDCATILDSWETPGYRFSTDMTSPRHFKTHLPFSLLPPQLLDTCKVVYVARNPKDVAVSYYHHNRLLTVQGYQCDFATYWNYFEHNLHSDWLSLLDSPNRSLGQTKPPKYDVPVL
uniref:Sulfotransferase domain-containing protein n=1 Tax=Timema shepardi TaxID=629360 RepID=A0A7R9AWM5_TIMSH|nr:unnamed protein product [Timema shepardi]